MKWLSQIFGFFRAFQCWIVIAPWELGLRVRAGKTSAVMGPGIHGRIPFMDRMFVQSARLRTISDPPQTMTSSDGRVLTLAVSVSYAIADIRKLYMTVSNPEVTLLCQIQGIVAETIATLPAADLTPQKVEQAVNDRLPNSEWGLSQVRAMITTFAFVRTFRLMGDGYRATSAVNDLEQANTPR